MCVSFHFTWHMGEEGNAMGWESLAVPFPLSAVGKSQAIGPLQALPTSSLCLWYRFSALALHWAQQGSPPISSVSSCQSLAYAWHHVSCFRADELEATSALCTGHSYRGSGESPGPRLHTLGFKSQPALLAASTSFS